MKSIRSLIVSLTVLGLLTAIVSPIAAQPGRPWGPPPPGPHHHHGPSDFDKTMRVIGAVGAIAAVANGYTPYGYNRYRETVVVVPQRAPIVVEKQIVVEKPVVVEKPIYIEKPVVPAAPDDYYSPKLGGTFVIQKMQIPGHKFTAARLTSPPVEGSPLDGLGLKKGDVITRLDDEPVDSLAVLERHEKSTAVRYIRTGTTKVLLGKMYIPTDAEISNFDDDVYIAP